MNQSKIYVGNLSYSTTEAGIREFFEQYGEITEARLISDRDTGRSKGFAFVTFSNDEQGKSALDANGTELDGRALNVNTAKDKDDSRGGGRSGGGRHYARHD